jgi:hypothetical protein
MFDPTVFENLKVVAEGAVYDLDLAGAILVTNRRDIVDLATMSRTYSIAFMLREAKYDITALFSLTADVKNLAGEILEDASFLPGCGLQLQFLFPIPSPASFVERVDEQLHLIWGEERSITQVISYEYNKEPLFYSNTATVLFQKTTTEEHAEDLSAVVDHMVETLERLQELLTNLN